jgi:hypothetical protein
MWGRIAIHPDEAANLERPGKRAQGPQESVAARTDSNGAGQILR